MTNCPETLFNEGPSAACASAMIPPRTNRLMARKVFIRTGADCALFLGGGLGGFAVRFCCRLGVTAARTGGAAGFDVLLCRLFVAFAAVIGDVEAAAFEDQPGARADLALDPTATFLLRAPDRQGALRQRL